MTPYIRQAEVHRLIQTMISYSRRTYSETYQTCLIQIMMSYSHMTYSETSQAPVSYSDCDVIFVGEPALGYTATPTVFRL